MSTPVLVTKLYVPPPRPEAIRRPRLIGKLNEGLDRKLTLVSAPAGFGKTTLLSMWLAESSSPAAWLSLDERDSDFVRFLTYLVAALEAAGTTAGQRALHVLQSRYPPPPESVLTTLVNEVSTIPDELILVLDDYHAVGAQSVDDALAFLIEHLPPQIHLVVSTREDPRVSLPRLRAQGQLTELRASDLRFEATEAAAFLSEAMGLSLSPDDVAALEAQTEGWVAGLQLAALSIKGLDDATEFISAFSGSNRYIFDYLAEEVLGRQSERIRRFLLLTSVLERLSGSLCDTVADEEGSNGILDALERGNLFVVPLDSKRRWYRYHHLFRDALQARLQKEKPELVPNLHQRASAWCEGHGLSAEAIHHALAAEDYERAADLVELAAPATRRSREEAMLLRWLKALPDELIRHRPVLCAEYVGALFSTGQLDAAEVWLRDAERWVADEAPVTGQTNTSAAQMVVVSEEEFESLPIRLSIYRAVRAQAQGDAPLAAWHAQRVLDRLPEEDCLSGQVALGRGAAAALLGLASWASGDLDAAHDHCAEGMALLKKSGNVSDAISGTLILADIRMAQGRLREATGAYKQAIRNASEHGHAILPGVADLHAGLSELLCEQGDVAEAVGHLARCKELGEPAGLPENRHRWYIAEARLKQVQGDLHGTLRLLSEAERMYYSCPVPVVRPIAALKARVWARQGNLAEAVGWAHKLGLTAHDDLSYLREFEHITLARILVAQYRSERDGRSIQEAIGLLGRLLEAAEEGGRTGSAIEILVLQALAHQAKGDLSLALDLLRRALALAEPEGYIRLFVDEGEAMRDLLRHIAAQGTAWGYTQQVLAAFNEPSQPVTSAAEAKADGLVNPLTDREVEVMRLIAIGMKNREIADHLFISLSTVKRHIANAYGKMDVGHRTEAVARARELNLL